MITLLLALIKEKLISEEQLNEAKIKNIGAKKPIQELLVEMGFIKEEDLIKVASKVFNMPIVDLSKEVLDPAVIGLISYDIAKRYGVFPLRKENDILILAMSNPQDVIALDDIQIITKLKAQPILCTRNEINNCIDKCYQVDDSLYDILKNVTDDTKIELIKETDLGETTIDVKIVKGENMPITRLTNLILGDAVKMRATDIHIEPQEKVAMVRYRIDGDLRNIMEIPRKLHPSLVSRIKILADLDIAETRSPQDGRIKIVVASRKIDLRISIIPAFYGEKIAIRLLDPKETKTELDKIGLEENELNIFKQEINRPQGIILVTGPTGSGKTTTLYATLNFTKSETKNIVTIEDPIEYLVSGINQMQVNPSKNVTFANGLRSILRQDPNVILVGEIRDRDTADIAFRASLTGHLVFSTLHTNNSVASVTRLLDIGLEPYLISSSLIFIVAQRLVKIICPFCKEEYIPDEKLVNKFKTHIEDLKIKKFYKGKGCQQCGFTGFLGRTAVFELFRINEKIRNLIAQKATEEEIFREAKSIGLKTLLEAAFEKVAKGITTIDEMLKVIGSAEEDAALKEQSGLRGKLRILIADDDEDILTILDKRISDAGYQTIKARDGAEVVALACKEKPDLIVTDVTMPKMNGFDVALALRSKLETAVIPIIMLTARQDKESELKGIDSGADDYIFKPFDADKLLARIKMLLRRIEGGSV